MPASKANRAAECHPISRLQGVRLTGPQRLAVHLRAIRAAQVYKRPALGCMLQARMLARDLMLIQDNVADLPTADDDLRALQIEPIARQFALFDDKSHHAIYLLLSPGVLHLL
jgi:hypothetical protein